MAVYTIPRTGDAPLRFEGTLLAAIDGVCVNGKEQDRCHELDLYQSVQGDYVLVITYSTRWQGEEGHSTVVICPLPDDVVTALRLYDPRRVVAGYPPGKAFEERQARLLADISRRYQSQISQLLGQQADLFAEEVQG